MGQWDLINLRFKKHKLAVISLALICGMYFIAIFAGFFAMNDPMEKDIDYIFAGPIMPRLNFSDGLHIRIVQQHTDPITLLKYYSMEPDRTAPLGFFVKGYDYRLLGLFPCRTHFFGVNREKFEAKYPGEKVPRVMLFGGDKFGRDIYSRILQGGRISLSIGVFAIVISFALGVSIGGVSGYFGGLTDAFIQRSIEIINAFPKLPLWLALGAALPRTWSNLQVYLGITVILSIMGWTGMARVVRGKILSLREEDYAVAAELLGASHARVLFRHLVPGFASHIIVSLTMTIPGMILGETSLSFLGLGLKPPTISWGVMLQDCMSMQIVKNYPWLLLPVGAIIIAVMCFNFMGDGLRDAADPYNVR
ncbi:ABC transporter permease [Candidatus Sumerlaeota bacterium]|nr:ABC transporter permease [Candidatus Sumerlaeota bacterium]